MQYYDSRNLLVPSELSEGGRRLYNDDDLKKLKIICFLREAGLPINSISALFAEENTEEIISVLLEQQETALKKEMEERQKQLSIIDGIKTEMKDLESFSVESIGDIAHLMENKIKLKKLRTLLVLTGVPVTLLFWTSMVMWVIMGMWWMFVVSVTIAVIYGVIASNCYFKSVAYICPHCHQVFKPSLKEALLAYHTPKMRRLTCPQCNHKGLCIEIFAEKETTNND